jgi:hypothetical protein
LGIKSGFNREERRVRAIRRDRGEKKRNFKKKKENIVLQNHIGLSVERCSFATLSPKLQRRSKSYGGMRSREGFFVIVWLRRKNNHPGLRPPLKSNVIKLRHMEQEQHSVPTARQNILLLSVLPTASPAGAI